MLGTINIKITGEVVISAVRKSRHINTIFYKEVYREENIQGPCIDKSSQRVHHQKGLADLRSWQERKLAR